MSATSARGTLMALFFVGVAACTRGGAGNRLAGDSAGGPGAPAATAPARYNLAAGTVIDAALTSTISSRQGKAGDAFTASVVEDVRNAGGAVAIPAGAMIRGAIVEVSPAPNTRSTGTLTLAVSSVTVGGTTYDLDATIDSLETVHQGRGVEPVDVARTAGGAAAGAILGQVITRNSKGTIIGGVVGGAAGAVVSARMKDMDIVLPAGSHLILTLRQRLTVTAH